MSRWDSYAAAAVALAGLPVGEGAQAAGFALKEQSTTAQGTAFAGATASASDVSYMFFNPASLGWVDRVEIQAIGTAVMPKVELKGASGSTAFGTPITGGLGGVGRTLVGALIVSVVRIGMTFVGIDIFAQQIVFGVVLIVTVAVTMDRDNVLIAK